MKMAKSIQPVDCLGRPLRVGDSVVVREIPRSLLAGLPDEDQTAIAGQLGATLVLADFDEHGLAELEFLDAEKNQHTIWIEPQALEKVNQSA